MASNEVGMFVEALGKYGADRYNGLTIGNEVRLAAGSRYPGAPKVS
jgi:hypothetical protein